MAQPTTHNLDVYQPRNPKASAYYKCVENHFEELEQVWDDMYKSRYGYWRTYVMAVIYTSKDKEIRQVFNALDWLARLVTHIPGRYEHTVRYYGYFSNKSRGLRKKAETDDAIVTIMQNEMSSTEARQNWARLIQKIYEVDPLVCPKCQGKMKIISFIEDLDVIEKILRHLGLWDSHNHDPPQAVISDFIPELAYDFSASQIPAVDYWN